MDSILVGRVKSINSSLACLRRTRGRRPRGARQCHKAPFAITEEWPTPLVRDFGVFLEAEEPRDAPLPPFYQAFLPLLPVGAATRGMPRVAPELKDQTLVFRVALARAWRRAEACERTIAISSQDTLEGLHLAIQEAFGFDNDHLYAFYMDGKPHSRQAHNDARGGEPPYACDATLGLLDLCLHQHILYLFDFGDCWQFEVVLTEVRDKPHKGDARIIKRKGKAPKQYPDWE